MKKVAVLMSTYNGERYVKNQIESILSQTYSNMEVYVRDDGSKDNTVKILRQYEDYPNFHLIEGDNLGYPESFYALMAMDIQADYYSFSDQDDVWNSDKIEKSVERLSNISSDKPALYFAAYEVCDSELNPIEILPKISFIPSFRNSLFQCLALGYTMVLNKKAKDICLRKRSTKTISKDVWIGMICSGLGEIVFDSESCAKYRRNDGAFSNSDTRFFAIQKERFTKLFKGDGFTNIKNLMSEFYDVFSDELPQEKKAELELFLPKNQSFTMSVKKVFYPHRLRYSFADEIMLRVMFLLGRV